MSLRKAKLLLEKKKQNQARKVVEEEEEDEAPQKKNVISFATFNQSQSEEEQKYEPVQQKVKQQISNEEQTAEKKKKKKKKKNKNKNKEKQQQDEEQREIKQVKQTLKQLNMGQNLSVNKEEDNEEWAYILTVNQSKFNYEKQMRRHFRGWQPQKKEGDPDLNKKQQKMQKHMKKMMKKSVLSPGTTDFFQIRQKFDIQRQDNTIKFQASKKYDSIQKQYQIVRNSNDVNALFQFSQMNPEHVDSLYSIGQFLRLQGNYRDADNLIQRVIYIYEMAGGYDLLQFVKEPFIKKYIVYDQYSTSFFMSLFKFIDILGKKGCFRTALEYNKFLLKINTNDPTACLFSIDFNAISSKQYQYLIQFTRYYSSYIGAKNQSLYLLPNFCYSVGLAQFLNQSEPKKESQLLVQQNSIVKYLDFKDEHWEKALVIPSDNHSFVKEDPRVLILRAIMVYPKLIIDIATKNEFGKQFLNHEVFKGWQKKPYQQILAHEFWTEVLMSYSYYFLKLDSIEDSQGLDKILEVYVERSKILWKSNNVMLWVKGALGMVLNKIEENFNYQNHLEKLCLQETKAVPIPFNLGKYSNINKNNFSDRVDRIDLNNIQDNQQMGQQQGQVLNMNQNPFSLFINSLLPWVNLPGAQQQQFDPDMPFIEEDDA